MSPSMVFPYPTSYLSPQGLPCSSVLEMVSNVKALRSETELLLAGKMALVSRCFGHWPSRGDA